jgi:hypothetical protein
MVGNRKHSLLYSEYIEKNISDSCVVSYRKHSPCAEKDVRQFEIRLDKYWEHQDVKFEYKASIQNKENTRNHTEISCIKEEVEVDIVAESQHPQMT